jgi:hypothetical protein
MGMGMGMGIRTRVVHLECRARHKRRKQVNFEDDGLALREEAENRSGVYFEANPASVAARLERTLTNKDAAAGKATCLSCALSASRLL